MDSKHPKIIKAYEFACKAHIAQSYDHFPYSKHLEDVYETVRSFGFSEAIFEDVDMLCSALLHDILEDTATSYSDVKNIFGVTVAETVYCMTDEQGRTRKEKKEKTLPKIRSNPDSIIIKLCDRISNIRHSIEHNNLDKISMYKGEHKSFRWALYVPDHCDAIWRTLNELVEYKS